MRLKFLAQTICNSAICLDKKSKEQMGVWEANGEFGCGHLWIEVPFCKNGNKEVKGLY